MAGLKDSRGCARASAEHDSDATSWADWIEVSSSMCGNVVMVGTRDDVVPFGDFLVEGLGLVPVILQRVGA